MRRVIRLTESDLHKIVAESVKQAINEIGDTPEGQKKLGAAAARRYERMKKNNPDSKEYKDQEDYCDRIEQHAKRRYKESGQTHTLGNGHPFDNGWDEYEMKHK